MKKAALFFCGILFAAVAFGENFPNDFQAAFKLVNDGKNAEAEEAFVKLAGLKAGKHATDASLAQAAYCALKQQKYAKAMEYAGKIEDQPLNTLCRMKILQNRGQWDAIIALSKDADIETWPDALIFDALLCRGRSHAAKKDVPNAEKDYLGAAKNTLSADNKAFACQFLGDLYRDAGKDNRKAIATYGEVLKIKGLHPNRLKAAAASMAKLLAAEGRGAEAVAALDQLQADKDKDPFRYGSIQMCYGEVYAIIGKKPEALARYKMVAGFEKAGAGLRAKANRKIEELEKEPPGN